MIRGTEDTRYAYVNGIIRAREARLLSKNHFDRLIASDLSSFNTILADTPYIEHEDIPRAFEAEETSLRKFFNKYCLTTRVKKFLDWPEQVHNLKVKLKKGNDDLMYLQERSDVENWPEAIDEVARFAIEKDPFILSTNLDKILCKYLRVTAKFAQFFDDYFSLYFDLENIRSFFRARQFDNRREIFIQVFIPYGRLEKQFFLNNLDTDYGQLGRNFFITPYVDIVDKGGAYFDEHRSFIRLERMYEEIRLGYLLQARRMTFGVEPLFTYYHFKINEIKKLRQVYWGKMNEVSVDQLKESIADVW